MSFEVTVTPTVYNVEVEVNPSVQPFDVVVEVGNVPDLDLTTNGDSGASTFDPLTGELNIPEYTLDGLGGVPESRTITINGTTQDLSADRTFTIPAPDPVTIGSPANGLSITSGQVLSIGLASGSTNGALSSTDWTTFNGKQNALGFTAENVANKAINLTSPDDTKYPTTLAVSTALAGKQNALTNPITGTGVSGQVSFWNGTGTQTGDNGLFWDNVNKRLGVGTNSPSKLLDVNGGSIFSGALEFSNASFLGINKRLNTTRFFIGMGNDSYVGHGGFRVFYGNNFSTVGDRGGIFDYFDTRNSGTGGYNVIGTDGASSTVYLKVFTTGNLLLQNGGTFTDAGFRLDVNGTARVQGAATITANTSGASNYSLSITDGNTSNGTSIFFRYQTNSGFLLAANNNGFRFFTEGGTLLSGLTSSGSAWWGGDGLNSNNKKFNYYINSQTNDGDGIQLIDAGQAGNVGAAVTWRSSSQSKDMAQVKTLIQSSYNNTILQVRTNDSSGVLQEAMRISFSGVGINVSSLNPSAQLQIDSTTRGFLPPRLTTTQRNAIATPATGLEVYNSTNNSKDIYNGSAWVNVVSSSNFDGLDVAFGTSTGTKIGTATSQKLSLWNATPNVQPTTAITAGAFVANTSGITDDTATFDGYTIGQVVAALRRIGALA
jgi:hypothetical protein